MSPGTESSPRAFPPPPESGIEVTEDAWLAARFGHPVLTVRVASDVPDQKVLEGLSEGSDPATYQVRVEAAETETASALQGVGFAAVGATITLGRPSGADDLPESPLSVRPAEPERDEAVGEIAARAFVDTRFHTDARIPDEVANAVKRDWALNSLRRDRGDGIWVALRDEAVIGFLARLQAPDGAAVIDLVAVEPDARSGGAGAALVRCFLEDARERGQDRARVGTQLANPRALAFYERLGFRAERAELDLHLHVGDVWPR